MLYLAALSPLTDWANFYVIMGSSAGALTGLTFVVISLVGEISDTSRGQGTAAYTTPTVVHFGVVLLAALLLSAPWPALSQASVALGLVGLGALGYTAIIARRILRLDGYQPVLEDWLGHVVAPVAAYLTMIVSAVALSAFTTLALFGVAGAMTLMLLVSIHNAWDVVTYVVTVRLPQRNGRQR